MENEFKCIKGFENLYVINENGVIKSLPRKVVCKDGQIKPIKERILKYGDNGTGYKFVYLWKNNIPKRYYVHRLVAETFIANPDNLPEINHIDRNKNNNNVNNLEWCNRLYNERAKTKHISGYKPKAVLQIDLNNNIIKEFESINECSRLLHHCVSTINKCIVNNKTIHKNDIEYKLKFKI